MHIKNPEQTPLYCASFRGNKFSVRMTSAISLSRSMEQKEIHCALFSGDFQPFRVIFFLATIRKGYIRQLRVVTSVTQGFHEISLAVAAITSPVTLRELLLDSAHWGLARGAERRREGLIQEIITGLQQIMTNTTGIKCLIVFFLIAS